MKAFVAMPHMPAGRHVFIGLGFVIMSSCIFQPLGCRMARIDMDAGMSKIFSWMALEWTEVCSSHLHVCLQSSMRIGRSIFSRTVESPSCIRMDVDIVRTFICMCAFRRWPHRFLKASIGTGVSMHHSFAHMRPLLNANW